MSFKFLLVYNFSVFSFIIISLLKKLSHCPVVPHFLYLADSLPVVSVNYAHSLHYRVLWVSTNGRCVATVTE